MGDPWYIMRVPHGQNLSWSCARPLSGSDGTSRIRGLQASSEGGVKSGVRKPFRQREITRGERSRSRSQITEGVEL